MTNFRRIAASVVAVLALTGATIATTAPAEAVNSVRVVKGTNYVNGI